MQSTIDYMQQRDCSQLLTPQRRPLASISLFAYSGWS